MGRKTRRQGIVEMLVETIELPAAKRSVREQERLEVELGKVQAVRGERQQELDDLLGGASTAIEDAAAGKGAIPRFGSKIVDAEAALRAAQIDLERILEAIEHHGERVGAHLRDPEIMPSLNADLDAALDEVASRLPRVPVTITDEQGIVHSHMPADKREQARIAYGELAELDRRIATIRRLAADTAELTFARSSTAPGPEVEQSALGSLVFRWRTGHHVLRYREPSWPDAWLERLRFVIANRAELGPWVPTEEQWRAALEVAREEVKARMSA